MKQYYSILRFLFVVILVISMTVCSVQAVLPVSFNSHSTSQAGTLLSKMSGEGKYSLTDKFQQSTAFNTYNAPTQVVAPVFGGTEKISRIHAYASIPYPACSDDTIDLGNMEAPSITSPPYIPVGEVHFIQGLYPFAGNFYSIAIDDAGTIFSMAEPVH